MPPPTNLFDESQAIEVAKRQIGIAPAKGMTNRTEVKTRQIVCHPETIPFFRGKLGKQGSWEVSFKKLGVINKNIPGRIPHVKDFTTLLHPQTGHILKVASDWPKNIPPIAPFPPAIDEEEQSKRCGGHYVGFPEAPPEISLCKALEAIDRCMGTVTECKQIIAAYVIWQGVSHRSFPAWVVQLRGIPPIPPFGPPDVSFSSSDLFRLKESLNHLRNIVDAETGQFIQADTVPQPVTDSKGNYRAASCEPLPCES